MRVAIRLSAEARGRLRELREFYAERGEAARGRRIVREVLRPVRSLRDHPEMGPREPALESLGLGHRSLVAMPRYKVVYRVVSAGEILITDVFDVRQRPSRMRG